MTSAQKRILVTGATDGIGLGVAHRLAADGHSVILHGRNPAKLRDAAESMTGAEVFTVAADLSRLDEVDALATELATRHAPVDVVVNNAGVFKTPHPRTDDGLDVRFVVNTIAPYLLARRLLPHIPATGRIVNLSSAAQAPVDLAALAGGVEMADMDAYAQSKLAITMWTRHLADERTDVGPTIVAVNPGSLLATKMVKEGFGMPGNDLSIGVDIVTRAALSSEFADAGGAYYDNDAGQFAAPHPDALDSAKNAAVVRAVEAVLTRFGQSVSD